MIHLGQIFNSGLIIGLLILLYPNVFVFSFMIIVTCLNYGNISFRIILSYLIGILVPVIFYVCYLLMFEYDFPSYKIDFSYDLKLPVLNKNELFKKFFGYPLFSLFVYCLYMNFISGFIKKAYNQGKVL